MSGRTREPVREPLAGVHGEAIYWFFHFRREPGSSWWEGCCAIEDALIATGWTPPAGYQRPAPPDKPGVER